MPRLPTATQLVTLLDVVATGGAKVTTAQLRSVQKRGLVNEDREVTPNGAAYVRDMMTHPHRAPSGAVVLSGIVMLSNHDHAAKRLVNDAVEALPAYLRGPSAGAQGCEVIGWRMSRDGLGVTFCCIGPDARGAASIASINVADIVAALQSEGLTVTGVRMGGDLIDPDGLFLALTA